MIRFKVNDFTEGEWAEPHLGPIDEMDVGQEQSYSHITQIAWSASGLALHDRPILTIVTSNGLASMWMSVSDIKATASWQRIAVINDLMREHHEPSTSGIATIRSVGWNFVSSRGNGEAHEKCHFVLGAADTEGCIKIFEVCSPYFGQSQDWEMQLLSSFALPHSSIREGNERSFNKKLQNNRGGKELRFGPVIPLNDRFYTVLSCTCTSRLFLYVVWLYMSPQGELSIQTAPPTAILGSSFIGPSWHHDQHVSFLKPHFVL